MSYLTILKYGVKALSLFAQYLRDQKMMEAGANKLVLESLANAENEIENAIFAGNHAAKRFDDVNGLPDNEDPNLRD